jgi:hypothetical protein
MLHARQIYINAHYVMNYDQTFAVHWGTVH